MIPAEPTQRRITRSAAPLLGLTVAAEAALSYGTAPFASNLLCDLALIAAFVAASERRHKEMLAAAGLACGLALYGAMLLPLAIGLAVSRRAALRALLLVPLFACGAMIALGTPTLPPSSIGLWSVSAQSGLIGLLAALALGSLAWLAATLSARPIMPDMLPIAALACALCWALVMPGASMALPLALALVYRDRRLSLLTGLAALMAVFALPTPAMLALGMALALAARPLLTCPANDNPPFFARKRQFATPA